MSVVTPDIRGEKVVVRGDEDATKWRNVAMFMLYQSSGWTTTLIAKAFGHPRGHVSRCIRAIRKELKEKLADHYENSKAHGRYGNLKPRKRTY